MRIGSISSTTSARSRQTRNSSGVWAATNSWNGPICFLHPERRWNGSRTFSRDTDKSIQFFTVGFVHVPKIHQLVARYPGRINFELSVITLSEHRQRLMPHAPSVKHVMKVLDGPAVSSANFYAFDENTMSKDEVTISAINQQWGTGWGPSRRCGV